jgi:hypothetical protein
MPGLFKQGHPLPLQHLDVTWKPCQASANILVRVLTGLCDTCTVNFYHMPVKMRDIALET